MSWLEKRPTVVAEILFLLFKFGDSMLDPTVRLYIYEGVCMKEVHNFTGCEDISIHTEWEDKIQTESAKYLFAYKMLVYIPAIILSLFAGAWCDHVGRKIPVVLPCFGTILAVLMYMLSMVCGRQAMLPLVLVGAALRGLSGKSAVITMALHSYVSDVTSKEDRTQKLGQLLAMNYFGYFAGSLLAGALLGYTTYDVIFCVVVLIMAVAVVVGLVLMRESLPHAAIIDAQDVSLKDKVIALRKSPFHVNHLKEVLDVLRRPRQGRGRLHIAVLFAVIAFNQLTKSGENDILLLMVKRAPLLWSKSQYGYLVATDYACLGAGAILVLPALVTYFHAGDLDLVCTGLLFKILRLFMLSFADVTWMVFAAMLFGGPVALVISGCKSVISKSVEEDELGKVFSLLSCSEMISNLLGSLIFTSLYSASIHLYPGFVFTLDGASYVLAFLLVVAFACVLRRDQRLNLLYNTLNYSDYGSASENLGKDGSTTPVSSDATNDGKKIDQPNLVEKRLSRISEDGVERMTVNNSKWKRTDSSSSSDCSDESPKSAASDNKSVANGASRPASDKKSTANGAVPIK